MPLNDYELVDEIQRTAMSTVYRFRDGEGRIVAVKRPPLAPVRVLHRRFKREIETMRKFAGPNTMPVLEFDPSFEWYGMPLASRTLQQVSAPQPAPLALKVLGALSVAHPPSMLLDACTETSSPKHSVVGRAPAESIGGR